MTTLPLIYHFPHTPHYYKTPKEVSIIFYQSLLSRKVFLQKQITHQASKIASLPENELFCIKNGNYTKWFQRDEASQYYIPKKERSLAELLALKKLYTAQLLDLSSELELIETCLVQYQKPAFNHETRLLNSPCYTDLLSSYLNSQSDFVREWLHSDHITNPSHPENLIHKTLNGHPVRSKSEVIIANSLFLNHIPYVYEKSLSINNTLFFPDFSILHPLTHQLFYWEHFGMMDNCDYRNHSYNKLQIYGSNGIIPTFNLITTFEDKNHPLDSSKVEQIVKEYFCSSLQP